MAQLRILISGAGIAGTALAFWLSKLGHCVTVVERFPALRVNGLQLDLRGHGIAVMKSMGLEAEFRASCAPEQGVEVVDTHGTRWAFFGANTSGKGSQSFTSEYEIMRGDMCRIMYDATRDRVKYVFGTWIESYEDVEGAAAVKVRLADGTVGEFDLVVGADGLRSRTRRSMFDAEDSCFQALDENIAYLRIPRPVREGEAGETGEAYVATAYLAAGGRFVLTRRNNEHQLQVYLSSRHVTSRPRHVERGDVEGEKRAFEDEFRGAGWRTDELLDAMLESDDFYCESQGLIKLETWSRGRVTLVGDAGYSSSASGLGTSAAMIGAYVLAGEIGRHVGRGDEDVDDVDGVDGASSEGEGVRMALDAYERRLRPLVDKIQQGMEGGGLFDGVRWTAWQVRLVYWAAWFASAVRMDRLLGWVVGYGSEAWALPDYEELK